MQLWLKSNKTEKQEIKKYSGFNFIGTPSVKKFLIFYKPWSKSKLFYEQCDTISTFQDVINELIQPIHHTQYHYI